MGNNASVALLLEDEPLISMDVEILMEGAGFDVTTVMTCSAAHAWLDHQRPDLAIVDIVLRDGPCDSVVARLVEAQIPFVVHSGDTLSMHAGTPFAHGAWVSKPSGQDELIDAARALLAA